MALFKTEEEKNQQQLAKVQKLMKRYHIENVSSDIADDVKDIATDLSGNKLIEIGSALQGNATDSAKLSYLSAIMKQNWIIIKLLDEIAHK